MWGFNKRQVLLTCTLFIVLFGSSSFATPVFYDLQSEWSDSQNPNGVWSYSDGSGPITNHVDAYLPTAFAAPQPAWVYNAGFGPGHIVSWFKATDNGLETCNCGVTDWLIGDIITHTWDPFSSGISTPHSNVSWTSPEAGNIDINGSVWLARSVGRSSNWDILLNGVSVTGGSIFSGDAYDRANPFDVATGSGGASVLMNIPVVAGDQVKLLFTTTSFAGDFVGMNFGVELTPDSAPPPGIPEPTTLALMGLGLAGIGYGRRRSRKAA